MEALQKRISRLTGQLRGIQKMVEEKRDAIEILQQISAVKKAINGLTEEIIELSLQDKIPAKDQKDVLAIVKRAIDL
jgi:DNA-binding FrmR family transcriptional regulator